MSKTVLSLSVALGALVAAAGTAQATITVYTTQASFLAATTAQGVDNFQSLSITGTTASPINRVAGPYSYTAACSTSTFFGAGTGADHWLSTNIATDVVTFNNFATGVSAAGGFFFDSDFNGAFTAGDITVTATDGSGTVTQTIISATTTSFLGFVSDGLISNLTIAAVQGTAGTAIWPTANDFTLARSIPTPGAAALLGLGGLAAARRRR